MSEGMMAAGLALCVCGVAFLAWRIERQAMQLRIDLISATTKIEEKSFPEIPDFDELRESLEDLIADTIGNMRTPQLADHLGAMAQQFFQMKMAKQMQDLGNMLPTAPDAEESVD